MSGEEATAPAPASAAGGATYRELYLRAQERSDRQSALVDHTDIEPVFREAGYADILPHLGQNTDWIVWTPDSKDDPVYAYTPDLVGDISDQRERLADLLADAGVGTTRFINCLDGQKASFDTDAYRDPDDPEIAGNYGVKGGDPDDSGLWLVDIDVDDYDEAKESNPVVEDLRTDTLAVASAHTSQERPGHLYVAVRGDPTEVVHDLLGDRIDNPQASFGEIRLQEQYCVGPGSEVICGCDRCTGDAGAQGVNYGRYELAVEEPPVVWSEDEFRAFLEADPAIADEIEKRRNRHDQDAHLDDDSDAATGGQGGTFTGDVDARLALAQDIDEYVAGALQELKNPDDRSAADSALARAVGPWLNYDEDDIAGVLDDEGSKWQARSDDSYRDSVLNHALDRSNDVRGYDRLPYWALVEAAKEYDILPGNQIVHRRKDTRQVVDPEAVEGETYEALASAEAVNRVLEALEDRGIDHGWDPVETAGGQPDAGTVETCAPPAVDRVNVEDITDRWRTIRDRLDDLGDTPTIFADEAGSGKTTNTGIGLAERDAPHAVLFDKHEKAREYVRDDATPGEYFHLKGGGQPRADACLDAHHAGERCDEHGDTAACPRMCPVYDLGADHPVRVEYERLVDEVGPVRAHQLLGDDLPGHDDDGACHWHDQFDAVARAERVVGVHEYQTLRTVRDPASGPSRRVVVDETPSVDGRDRLLDVEALVRLANALEPRRNVSAPDDDPTDHNHLHARAELAAFARRVVTALTDPDAPDALADVEPPAFAPTTVEVEVDQDDLPAGVDPADVERKTRKESVGMEGDRYRAVRRHVAEVDLLAETLARAKQDYEGAVLRRIRSEDRTWNGTPLATDALLAAAAAAGADDRACRQAAAVPPELSACPRCHEGLEPHDGRLVCPACAWDEATDYLVGRDGDAARCDAELRAGGDGTGTGLHFRRLPHPSELPDAPLVLDATATPDKVAALYGVDREAVDVYGDDSLAVDQLRTTQVLDGQYHASTIRDTDSVRERVERTARKLADVHGNLLVVGKASILDTLDLPTDRETVDILHYHAARGLNRAGYDAVVAIGAPHPDINDLQRDAALLTQGRDDLRVGGTEHSTRRNCGQPPVYRKLDYDDADGDGRAVPTKHYTGLTGALFREGREKELEQVVHRIRPLLADDTNHAYLLTNVPTDLRVDEVCAFDELADPVEALLPVPEGALDLLEAVRDAAAGDLDIDGMRAERLVETVGGARSDEGDVRFRIAPLHQLATVAGLDITEKTVRRWVDGLTDLGLLDAGEYEYRAGVPYTADPATLTSALSVVSNNTSVEVAARRRFRAILAEADGTLSWLARARDVLGVRGGGEEVEPPPQSASPTG